MAIVFNCQHCNEPYKLKDELAGKSATCRNPNCRKSFVVPAPAKAVAKRANPPASKPNPEPDIDIDSIAAAAFSEEVEQRGPSGKLIDVTCRHCDHKFNAEADKAGKMTLCPECVRPTKVPTGEVEKKLDWRGNDGVPTLAKRDYGIDAGEVMDAGTTTIVEGKTIAAAGATQQKDAEEPEERRKRRIKRLIQVTLTLIVLVPTVYLIWGYRNEVKTDATMESAVKAIENPKGGATDPIFHAIVRRASGEYRSRNAQNEDDVKEALKDLQIARNLLLKVPATNLERDALLIEVAMTFPVLAGDEEQVRLSKKKGWPEIQKEIRQTLALLNPEDKEVTWFALRRITERLVQFKQPLMAADIAGNLLPVDTPEGQVALAHVGFELIRLGKSDEAAKLLPMVITTTPDPMFHGLRLVLDKEPKADVKKKEVPDPMAIAMSAVVQGDTAKAKSSAEINSTPENRTSRLVQVACQCESEKAAELLNSVAETLKADTKASPWLYRRMVNSLLKANQVQQAETLTDLVPNPGVKAWCKLDIARHKLAPLAKKKADDNLLDLPGDPIKIAASAKLREEMARHNAHAGEGGYVKIVAKWDKGLIKPFGDAGLILGKQDRDAK